MYVRVYIRVHACFTELIGLQPLLLEVGVMVDGLVRIVSKQPERRETRSLLMLRHRQTKRQQNQDHHREGDGTGCGCSPNTIVCGLEGCPGHYKSVYRLRGGVLARCSDLYCQRFPPVKRDRLARIHNAITVTYVRANVSTYVRVRVRVRVFAYMHVYIYDVMHTRVGECRQVYINDIMYTRVCVFFSFIRTGECVSLRGSTPHTHIYIHVHTHIHTYAQHWKPLHLPCTEHRD